MAERLGRQWIGIDISPRAVEIMKLRLHKLGAQPTVYGLPITVDDLRRLGPFEFQHWVINRVLGNPSPRRSGDSGIDGYSFFDRSPIQVKQSERVGRNVVDNFETAVERDDKSNGYIVAFSFTRGAFEEAARAKRQRGLDITLVTVTDVLQVGELIDAADREGRPPDLMGLFSALQQEVRERPFAPPDTSATKPPSDTLIESARRRRLGQQRLPIS